MIRLHRLRELDLDAPSEPGRPAFVSAASGLVCVGNYLYVVADDELSLGVFNLRGQEPGKLIRMLPGKLPLGTKKRKKHKPDFEALALLGPFAGYVHGALLALGSGSRKRRRRGVLFALDAAGAISGAPRVIDLSGLYAAAEDRARDLNVEGAVCRRDRLLLFHRGIADPSAVIAFPLAAVTSFLAEGEAVPRIDPVDIRTYELGEVDGIPLGFTDATALPDGSIVFSSIAEDTTDAYRDGPCRGAAVGIIDRDGDLRSVLRLDAPHKIEGLHAEAEGSAVRLLLVTDADDTRVPAVLFGAELR